MDIPQVGNLTGREIIPAIFGNKAQEETAKLTFWQGVSRQKDDFPAVAPGL